MKIAFIAFVLFLVVVPSLAYRIRKWDNAKCSGQESSSEIYSNQKNLCQPFQGHGGGWFKALSECKNGHSAILQPYDDGTCTSTNGAIIDSYVVNGGLCISSKVGTYYSYMVDCSSAHMTSPTVALAFIALLALFFF
jgi:hypothetical protein